MSDFHVICSAYIHGYSSGQTIYLPMNCTHSQENFAWKQKWNHFPATKLVVEFSEVYLLYFRSNSRLSVLLCSLSFLSRFSGSTSSCLSCCIDLCGPYLLTQSLAPFSINWNTFANSFTFKFCFGSFSLLSISSLRLYEIFSTQFLISRFLLVTVKQFFYVSYFLYWKPVSAFLLKCWSTDDVIVKPL